MFRMNMSCPCSVYTAMHVGPTWTCLPVVIKLAKGAVDMVRSLLRYYLLYWLSPLPFLGSLILLSRLGVPPVESSIIGSVVWVVWMLMVVVAEETMRQE